MQAFFLLLSFPAFLYLEWAKFLPSGTIKQSCKNQGPGWIHNTAVSNFRWKWLPLHTMLINIGKELSTTQREEKLRQWNHYRTVS
jgi:hypothetical protein